MKSSEILCGSGLRRRDLAASHSLAGADFKLYGTTGDELRLPALPSDAMCAEQEYSLAMKRFGCSDPSLGPPDSKSRLHHLTDLWQKDTPAPFGPVEEPKQASMDQPLATLAGDGSALVPSSSTPGDPSNQTGTPSTDVSSRTNQCPPVRGPCSGISSPSTTFWSCPTSGRSGRGRRRGGGQSYVLVWRSWEWLIGQMGHLHGGRCSTSSSG